MDREVLEGTDRAVSEQSKVVAPLEQGGHPAGAPAWVLLVPLLLATAIATILQPLLVPGLVLFVAASAVLSSPRVVKWAVLALAAYTPVETLVLNFVPDSLFMAARFAPQGLMLGCLLGVMVRRARARKTIWLSNPVDLPLLLFLAASVISFVLNRPPLTAALIAYQPFLRFILIAYYLVLLAEYDAKDAALLTRVLLLVAGIEAAVGIAQSFFSAQLNPILTPNRGEHGDYVIGGFSQPEAYQTGYQVFGTVGRYNLLGLYLAFFFVVSLPFFLAYREHRKRFYLLYALLLPCIFFTAARAPLLFIAAGVMVLFVVRKQWLYVLMPVAGLAILVGTGMLMGVKAQFVGYEDATAMQRIFEVFDPFYWYVHSLNGRLYYILRFPFEILSLGPGHALFGFGPGTLDWRTMEVYGLNPLNVLDVPPEVARAIPDVNWAYILGQAGYVALFAVAWMCWRLGKVAYRLHINHPDRFVRCLSEGFIAVLMGQCVGGLVGPVWEWRPTSLYFWLYAGIVVSLSVGYAGSGSKSTPESAP